HARTLGKRDESSGVARTASKSCARALSRTAVTPGTQDRSRTDVRVWRDAFARSERWLQRGNVSRSEDKDLYPRDEPRGGGKFDRTSSVHRRPRHNFAGRLAPPVDRPRKRR